MPSRSSRLARLPSTSTFECPEERSINLCKTQGTDLVLVQRDKPTFSEYKTGSLTSIIRSWKAWTSFSRRSASSCSYLPQREDADQGNFLGCKEGHGESTPANAGTPFRFTPKISCDLARSTVAHCILCYGGMHKRVALEGTILLDPHGLNNLSRPSASWLRMMHSEDCLYTVFYRQ